MVTVIRNFTLSDVWTKMDGCRAWEEFVQLYEVYGTNQPVNYTFQDNAFWRSLMPIVRCEVLRNIFIIMQTKLICPEPG